MAGTTAHNYILYQALSTYAAATPALHAVQQSHAKAYAYAKKNEHLKYRTDTECYPAGAAYIGACGPDLFYLEFGATGKFIADLLHYNKTGLFMIWCLRELKKLGIADYDPEDEFRKEGLLMQFAYCLGHISHIAADIVIHPYVNSIVRAYPVPDNQEVFKNARGMLPKAIWKFHNILEHYQDAYVLHKRFQGMHKFGAHWQNANLAQAGSSYYLKKENKSDWFLLKNVKAFYRFLKVYDDTLEQDKYNFFLGKNYFINLDAYYDTTIPSQQMMESMNVLVQGGTYDQSGALQTYGLFDHYLDWAVARTQAFWAEAEAYLAAPQNDFSDPELKEDKAYFPSLRRHWNLDCGLYPAISDTAFSMQIQGKEAEETLLHIPGALEFRSSHGAERADVVFN
jgi:hypothetical protein